MSFAQDIGNIIAGKFYDVVNRLNKTPKIAYQGYFQSNQTVIFYDDTNIRVFYDGTDMYIKVQIKTAGAISHYVKVVKGSTISQGTVQRASVSTSPLTLTGGVDSNYQLSGNVSIFAEFNLHGYFTQKCVYGHLNVSGNRLTATVFIK